MPFIAIIIDIITAGAYFFQLHNPSEGIYFLGLVVQAVFTLILLVMIFSYHGKRYATIQTVVFMKRLSIRYAIIIFSFLINGAVLFMYVLNYLGTNNLIFSAF